jgi:GNAT superfamily N-acetyltransferase
MEIRLAREGELPAIPGIELSAAGAFRGMDVPAALFEQVAAPEHWRPHLEAGLLWVAAGGDGPVGFLAAQAAPFGLHIAEVDVLRERQGGGLGRRLICAAIAEGRRRGCEAVTLTTFRDVPWNAPFYAKLGFEIWADPPEALAAILKSEVARGLRNRVAMRLPL